MLPLWATVLFEMVYGLLVILPHLFYWTIVAAPYIALLVFCRIAYRARKVYYRQQTLERARAAAATERQLSHMDDTLRGRVYNECVKRGFAQPDYTRTYSPAVTAELTKRVSEVMDSLVKAGSLVDVRNYDWMTCVVDTVERLQRPSATDFIAAIDRDHMSPEGILLAALKGELNWLDAAVARSRGVLVGYASLFAKAGASLAQRA